MLIKRIGNIYIDNIDALAKTLLEKFEEISSLVNNTGNFKRQNIPGKDKSTLIIKQIKKFLKFKLLKYLINRNTKNIA